MKHVVWQRVARWVERDLQPDQIDKLLRYRDWLEEEAIPAGGLGPDEAPRLDRRHIGDALLFAYPMDESPEEILDIGAGVGLPGIPLAILMGNTRVTLLDRSGRRVDLAKRAVRVLDIDNVEIEQGDATDFDRRYPVVVSRASLSPPELAPIMENLVTPGGLAVIGGSWHNPPEHPGWEVCEIPSQILDRHVWLLIMRRQ